MASRSSAEVEIEERRGVDEELKGFGEGIAKRHLLSLPWRSCSLVRS